MKKGFHPAASCVRQRVFACFTATLLCACCVRADMIVTLNTVDRGLYRDDGYHIPWYVPYFAGRDSGDEFHNFLLFDLSSITQEVVSAELRLISNGYDSPDPYETYTVHDVTTPLWELQNGYGDTAATYNDLGSGIVYGSVDVASNTGYIVVSVFLNDAGLAALNASLGGMFVVGGAITSLDSPAAQYEGLFSLSDPDRPSDGATQIVLTLIPEPGTLGLLALGGLALYAARRRTVRRLPPRCSLGSPGESGVRSRHSTLRQTAVG